MSTSLLYLCGIDIYSCGLLCGQGIAQTPREVHRKLFERLCEMRIFKVTSPFIMLDMQLVDCGVHLAT